MVIVVKIIVIDVTGGEGVSGDESEAGDREESVAGVGGQDASSTATIGSNLLYLSDEQVALSLEVVGVE